LQAPHAGSESKSTAAAHVQQAGDELFIHYEDSGVLSRAAGALPHHSSLSTQKNRRNLKRLLQLSVIQPNFTPAKLLHFARGASKKKRPNAFKFFLAFTPNALSLLSECGTASLLLLTTSIT
jgi:hypothetical protein